MSCSAASRFLDLKKLDLDSVSSLFKQPPETTAALNELNRIFECFDDVMDEGIVHTSQILSPRFDSTPVQQATVHLSQPRIFDATQHGQTPIFGFTRQLQTPVQLSRPPCFDSTPASMVDPAFQDPNIAVHTLPDNACALLDLLLSSDLSFGKEKICQFGIDFCTADDVNESFAPESYITDSWIQFYVHCLIKDKATHPQRKPYERLYLDIDVLKAVFQEGNALGDEVVEYQPGMLVNLLDRFLPEERFLQGVKEILLPVIKGGHYSIYVVNFVKKKVHIMDPNPWHLLGGNGWEQTHMAEVKYGNVKNRWCAIVDAR